MPHEPLITVHTDQGPLQLPTGSTVQDALQRLQGTANARSSAISTAVSTAVNGDFVPRHARSQTVLQHGDHLLCFTAITGG